MELGWIKIHRQILNWEWYDEPNTFRVFFHLLLKANHKPNKYRGVTIEAGQIMTGLDLLARETTLSMQKVRTSLNRLKSTNEITIKSNSKGTIIQIVNYSKYQITTDNQQANNKPITNHQQTNNKPSTTNKNDNNIENEKNEKKKEFEIFWNEYDKKVGDKTKVEKKYNKLSKEDKDLIKIYIPKYKVSQKEKQYRKNPETFLNNKGWLDELIGDKGIKKVYDAQKF